MVEKRKRPGLFIPKLVAVIGLLIIFQGFSTWLGGMAGDLFYYGSIDPDNAFAHDFVGSVIQMLAGLVAILLLRGKFGYDFGLKLGDTKTGIKYVLLFLFALIVYSIVYHYVTRNHSPYIVSYPLNLRNVLGVLVLEYGITGPSEEILFRALPIGLILIVSKRSFPLKWGVSLEVVIAALLFVLAHGQYVASGDFFFMGFTFVLGIVYGVTYQKTGSIVYPMIMHSVTNIVLLGVSLLIQTDHFLF